MKHVRDQRKPVNQGAARRRSFFIGLFYAAFLLAFDRCITLKSGMNTGVIIVMGIFALLIFIANIKVPVDSRFHLPMKPLSLLAGFFGGVLALYAFFGNMPGQQNLLQKIAGGDVLPPAVQRPFDSYIKWSAEYAVFELEKEKTE